MVDQFVTKKEVVLLTDLLYHQLLLEMLNHA